MKLPVGRPDPARLRFWGVVLPIHVAAFATLYFGTTGLLSRAYSQARADAARRQLDQAVLEMPLLVPHAGPGTSPHVFRPLLAAHRPLGLRLYRPDGELLGSSLGAPDPVELERVRALLLDPGASDDVWIETHGGRQWARGVVRLVAGRTCAECHPEGRTLGAATMKIDSTFELEGMRRLLRLRMGWILGAWLALVGAVTALVQITVRRSLARLDADLAAAFSGGGGAPPPAPPADQGAGSSLDPTTARLFQRLHDFLRRHREREAEVVSRLAHVDQLATLGQLSAGLAHEIKNPLAGIQGAIEVLRDDSPDPSTVAVYDDVLRELKRVDGILQRLLESGRKSPLRLARTDLPRLLEDVAELLRPALRRRRVDLRVDAPRDLPEGDLDAARLRQVLLNLVQNAGDALHQGGGRVTIRANALPENAGVVIEVEDDGPGIPAEVRSRLFEPFFTTKFTGTGLGLTISKALIEQHGGRIEVESEEGRGTTFSIFLPAGGPRQEVS